MRVRSFAEHLVHEGVIQTTKVNAVVEGCATAGYRADTAVLDLGLASEHTVLEQLGRFTRSRVVSAAQLAATPTEVASLISPRVAQRFGVVPFRRDGKTLHVAALDPGDLLVQDELGLMTGCMIVTYAALEVRLVETLARFFGAQRSTGMLGLAKRLTGGGVLPPISTRVRQPETETSSSRRPAAPTVQERHRRSTAERLGSLAPTELEMSDEDLAMFPSLAIRDGECPEESTLEEIPPVVSPTPETTTPPAPMIEPGPQEPDEPHSVEVLLARAAEALQQAEMRDDIGDALFDFTRPFLSRRLLLTIRGDTIVGWRGEGPGVEPTAVRAIAIPKNEPSVFLGLVQGTAFWLGPLPPMVHNQELRMALGDPEPSSCIVLPVKVRGKIVAFLYGDREAEPLGTLPMAEFKRLLAKADVAFQVYLLKAKIRTL